jgi:hypothetical protein
MTLLMILLAMCDWCKSPAEYRGAGVARMFPFLLYKLHPGDTGALVSLTGYHFPYTSCTNTDDYSPNIFEQ